MPLDVTKPSKSLDFAELGESVLTGDADVGDVKAGKTFYKDDPATRLTGAMPTKAIVAANDDYEEGYHAGNPGGLDAIETDLAPANIKQGVTIFGKDGTVAPGGVETIEKYADAVIADGATYTPAASGIFFSACGFSFTLEHFSTGDTTWYPVGTTATDLGCTGIGDGTNFRIKNNNGGNAEYILMRHYISTGTYERAMDQDLALGTQWTPATSGFFADAGESVEIYFRVNKTTGGWVIAGEAKLNTANQPITVIIGDGTNLQVANTSGAAAKYHVTMRAKMT